MDVVILVENNLIKHLFDDFLTTLSKYIQNYEDLIISLQITDYQIFVIFFFLSKWFLNRQWKSYFSSNAQNLCTSNSFFKAIQKNETRNNNNMKKMESIDCTCCAEPTINDGMFVVRSKFEWCMRESKLSKIKFYLQQSPGEKNEQKRCFSAAFDQWLWMLSAHSVWLRGGFFPPISMILELFITCGQRKQSISYRKMY